MKRLTLSVLSVLLLLSLPAKSPQIELRSKEKENTINNIKNIQKEATDNAVTSADEYIDIEEPEDLEKYNYDVPLDAELLTYIVDSCEQENIDIAIFFGMIEQESNFDINCEYTNTNGTIDRGLCQAHSGNYSWYIANGIGDENGYIDWFNPYVSVDIALFELVNALEKNNGDYVKALSMYNTGKVGVVRPYADEVLKRSEKYKK